MSKTKTSNNNVFTTNTNNKTGNVPNAVKEELLTRIIDVRKHDNNTYELIVKGKLIINATDGLLIISDGDIVMQGESVHLNPVENSTKETREVVKESFIKGLMKTFIVPMEKIFKRLKNDI